MGEGLPKLSVLRLRACCSPRGPGPPPPPAAAPSARSDMPLAMDRPLPLRVRPVACASV